MNLENILKDLPELEEGKNVCISLSGGLDSTVLVYCLVQKYGKERVRALSFNFGQRHTIELEMAKKTTTKLDVAWKLINLEYLADISRDTSALIEGSKLKPKTAEENAGNPQVSTYVPWRNAQFAFITAAFAETNNCSYILQATNQVDCYGYFDTTIEFRDALNQVFLLNRQNPVKLITPFVELYKDEELRISKEISEIVGYNILEDTWSCYNGDDGSGLECGKCNTCEEKLLGYIQAGFTDVAILNKFNIDQFKLNQLK